MKTKIFILMLSVFVLTGCATMRRNQTSQSGTLQTKIANLEEQVAARDQEIVSLRGDVDRLNDLIERQPDRGDNVSYHRVEYVPLPDAKSYSSAAGTGTEGSGSDGNIVRVAVTPETLQKALKAAGYYNGKIDGKIGDMTKTAIRDFQKYHDLKVDGIVGKSTWAALKSYVE